MCLKSANIAVFFSKFERRSPKDVLLPSHYSLSSLCVNSTFSPRLCFLLPEASVCDAPCVRVAGDQEQLGVGNWLGRAGFCSANTSACTEAGKEISSSHCVSDRRFNVTRILEFGGRWSFVVGCYSLF